MRISAAIRFDDREIGLLGLAVIEPFTGPENADATHALWGKPVAPSEIWIHRNFRYRRPLGAAGKVIGNHSLLCVDAIVAGIGMAMLGMWWSHTVSPQITVDWLASKCDEPIVLFGDGPMIRRKDTAVAYATKFLRHQSFPNSPRVTDHPA